MSHLKNVICALGIALVLTLGLAVATILKMMFSTTEDVVSLTGLFRAVFFKSDINSSGNLEAQMGVASPLILCAVGLAICCFVLLVVYIFQGLKRYRQQLIKSQSQ